MLWLLRVPAVARACACSTPNRTRAERRPSLLLVGALLGACAEPPKALPGHLAPCPEVANCVSSEALPSDAVHYVDPLRPPVGYRLPNDALGRLRAIAVGMPRAEVAGGGASSLRLTFTSRVFGFADDVELRVDAADGLVHVRSASRRGWGDGGVNRVRVDALRSSWDASFGPDDRVSQ